MEDMNNRDSLKNVTIRIPAEQHQKLKMYVVKNHTTVQELIGSYINNLLENKK